MMTMMMKMINGNDYEEQEEKDIEKLNVYLSNYDYEDDNYYDDEDNCLNLISRIVLLIHVLLNILMFTRIMVSHAVFSLGVVPLNNFTFCLLKMVTSESVHHHRPGNNSCWNKIHVTRQTFE